MRTRLAEAVLALGRIKTAAEAGFAHDEALIMGGVDGLIAQTRSIERVVASLDLGGIEIEGSDSLDTPSAVFK